VTHDWRDHAQTLAAAATHPLSRWRPIIAAFPRHIFIPRWFEPAGDGRWAAHDGRADPKEWMRAAYRDRSVVTRIGAHHADRTRPGATVRGLPTSSATLPGLLVKMYRHALLGDGLDILDAGTGSGYGAALLTTRFGDRVRSGDIDPYLVEIAALRCREAGRPIHAEVFDLTAELPAEFDRIVGTFSVPHVPASWVRGLRPGGRVVVTLADTGLILVLDKQDDGTLRGVTSWERAGFMVARHDDGRYADDPGRELARTGTGDVRRSPFPLVNVEQGWPLSSTFNLENPGVRHDFIDDGDEGDGDGTRMALMWAGDGSWARAESHRGDNPIVTQGGPRRLWDALDAVRIRWLREGDLPCYGAQVRVDPDGTTTLRRGRGARAWQAVLEPAPSAG
jgi:protein-L-isoaspartate O-methyltransferase